MISLWAGISNCNVNEATVYCRARVPSVPTPNDRARGFTRLRTSRRDRGDANPRVDDGYRRLNTRGSIANDARKRERVGGASIEAVAVG